MKSSARRVRTLMVAAFSALAVVVGSGVASPAVADDALVKSVSVSAITMTRAPQVQVTVTVKLQALEPGYTLVESFATLRPDGAAEDAAKVVLTEIAPGVLQGTVALSNDAKTGTWFVDNVSIWLDWPDSYEWYGSLNPASFYVKRATLISVNASPEPVVKGKTITVKGTLKRLVTGDPKINTDASYGGYAGKTVKIYFDPKGSKPRAYVGSATTTSTGAFSKKFTAKVDGTWSAQFAGTANFAPAQSTGDFVDVR